MNMNNPKIQFHHSIRRHYLADKNYTRVVRDVNVWLQKLGLPPQTLAIARGMRIGSEIILFDYIGPSAFPDGTPSRAYASIERRTGSTWCCSALWTIHVGQAARRGTILADGTFKIENNKKISWAAKEFQSIRRFERVVNLSKQLSRMALIAGDQWSAALLRPYPRYVEYPLCYNVPFLNTIAAPHLIHSISTLENSLKRSATDECINADQE
ncbi:hypothetical protein [Burkholderia alba]|uniref:hypothetical protein n=1 Tax=Burkholderia alba TaxID=2683677 RepID=UPI002B05ADCC|nr:hypothetical protein [Burkholderia alba]